MEKETVGGVRLDLKDKQLLFELDFDARQSVSQLAKKLRLSKQGVEYKMQRLTNEGVITGYYPVVNMCRLGYKYCRLVFSLRNADAKKEKEILDYLKDESSFFWVFSMQGIFDLGAVMWAKSASEFEQEVEKLHSKFGPFISRKNETIATDVVYLQSRYLLGTKETDEIHVAETSKTVEIDGLDKKILEVLSE
ncbi:Lrp/AsnC family transcriptional regulator, partial [Candidatus Micrarchaeota archaeon]|nr:Lrp/AsnC family transcriptional regulator [Candidatus Micrarchaeota archaeon]